MIEALPVERVFVRRDARAIDEAAIRGLVESIREVGIINPLRVRPARRMVKGIEDDAYEVTAGAHRLRAAKSIGMETVPCIVVEDDDDIAEMAMIDENLMRTDSTPAERASLTARRKAIYLRRHPETGHGGDRRSDQVDKNVHLKSFATATAAATGKHEKAIRRDAERGEKVCEQALALVRGTELDTGSYLDVLKKLEPKEQVARVQRRLASLEREKAERKAPRGASKPVIVKDDTDVEDDQYRALVNAWNKASPAVRMRFRECVVDVPVMDAAE